MIRFKLLIPCEEAPNLPEADQPLTLVGATVEFDGLKFAATIRPDGRWNTRNRTGKFPTLWHVAREVMGEHGVCRVLCRETGELFTR